MFPPQNSLKPVENEKLKSLIPFGRFKKTPPFSKPCFPPLPKKIFTKPLFPQTPTKFKNRPRFWGQKFLFRLFGNKEILPKVVFLRNNRGFLAQFPLGFCFPLPGPWIGPLPQPRGFKIPGTRGFSPKFPPNKVPNLVNGNLPQIPGGKSPPI